MHKFSKEGTRTSKFSYCQFWFRLTRTKISKQLTLTKFLSEWQSNDDVDGKKLDPTIAISFICQSTNIAVSVSSDSIKNPP